MHPTNTRVSPCAVRNVQWPQIKLSITIYKKPDVSIKTSKSDTVYSAKLLRYNKKSARSRTYNATALDCETKLNVFNQLTSTNPAMLRHIIVLLTSLIRTFQH